MRDPRTPVQCPTALTVPLWPIGPDGYCTCGLRKCATSPREAGKHPKPWGALIEGGGYGIYTGAPPRGSGIVVIDCDVKKDTSGIDNWLALCRGNLPDTLTIATGGGGFHFYFSHPGGGVVIGNSQSKIGPGIDVRGDGGFVVGPGSMHRSGRPYTVVHPSPLVPLPGWLLDWSGLYRAVEPLAAGSGYIPTPIDCTTVEGIRRMEAFRAECAGELGAFAPSVEGHKGHDRLLEIAGRGCVYWLLPLAVAADLISTYFNPRCTPAWDEYDIQRKCSEAIRINDRVAGPVPEDFATQLIRWSMTGIDPTKPVTPSRARESNPDHKYTLDPTNVIPPANLNRDISLTEVVFRLARHPQWNGVLRWDEFFDVVRAVNPPLPLSAETGVRTGVSDADVTSIRIWFESALGIGVTKETMRDAIEQVARSLRVHPVRDYLHNLPPGDPRLFDTLPMRLFGSSDPLDVELLKRFLVGAARRILQPGTQMDNMLVLFGKQGFKKSGFISTLFGSVYSSRQMPDLAKPDASLQIATVWGQEIGELARMLKAGPEITKDFLSRLIDMYRPPYGRTIVAKPRQCVFIGTTNVPEMLYDPTGERRYWIMHVLQEIDLAYVAAMRDQIWAAAMALAVDSTFEHYIKQGSELDDQLRKRQEPHVATESWESTVIDYALGRDFVTPLAAFRDAIMRNAPEWIVKYTNKEQGTIGRIFQRMGGIPEKRNNEKGYLMPLSVQQTQPSDAEKRRRANEGGAVRDLSALIPGYVANV